MGPKDADWMAKILDPDPTAPLIWVFIVCPGLSVCLSENFTVTIIE